MALNNALALAFLASFLLFEDFTGTSARAADDCLLREHIRPY